MQWEIAPPSLDALADVALAAAIALSAFALLAWARTRVRRWHERVSTTARAEASELPALVLSRTSLLFLALVSAYLGSQWLPLSPRAGSVLDAAATVAAFVQSGIWLTALALALLDRKAHENAADKSLRGSLGILGFVARVAIWVVVLLLALDNLGVDVTALIAGLGIGGIAVALAVQNVLGDLLASLSITLDKPFVVGDFLAVGDFLGAVEYIGIKSTRLRSLSGEQIVMSNADLLSSRLRNFGRMAERRVVLKLSVAYETAQEQLERVPAVLRTLIEREKQVRFDRSHFAGYGASGLEFETVYYVLSADFNLHMDIQQRIYFAVMSRFRELGVQFAYPTQRLLLERAGIEPAAQSPRRSTRQK